MAAGIALRVVPDGTVVDEALALAAKVAEAPLTALRSIKGAMLGARADAVAAARAREEAAFAALFGAG